MAQPHGASLAEGALGGLTQHECRQGVVARHCYQPISPNGLGEVFQLEDICTWVAFDEVRDVIDSNLTEREPLDVHAAVVAAPGCCPRAHHLRRALIPIARRAAVVDDAERPA